MATKLLFRNLITESKIIEKKTKLIFKQPQVTCYNIIADIQEYPKFVSWIQEANLLAQDQNKSEYSITFGFSPLIETYQASVIFEPNRRISLYSNKNEVFDTLESIWELTPQSPVSCEAIYSVKFRFNSPLYQRFSSVVINKIFSETSKSFVKQIDQYPHIKYSR